MPRDSLARWLCGDLYPFAVQQPDGGSEGLGSTPAAHLLAGAAHVTQRPAAGPSHYRRFPRADRGCGDVGVGAADVQGGSQPAR